MHNFFLTLAVAVLAVTSTAAQPRRAVYPASLDAGAIEFIEHAPSRSQCNTVNCLIELAPDCDASDLTDRYGVRLNTVTGSMASALVETETLLALASDPTVIKIWASEAKTMTDEAVSQSGAGKAHSLDTPFKGKGIIIGVIDSGFDFLHPAFLNSDGTCRIGIVWDQNRPSASLGSPSTFGYGVVFDNSADIAKAAHDMSGDTHGTHVAAIAASSADVYGGIAPDASLAFVSTDRSEAGIVDGLKFLLDYAEEQGKPLAVNISMGTVIGFKDGNDPLARMIDGLLKDRSGQLVAIAAGNEGHRKSTIVTDKPANDIITTRLMPPSYNRENLFVGSSAGDFTLKMSLHNADGSELFCFDMPASAEESTRYDRLLGSDDGSFVAVSPSTRTDGKHSIAVNLYCPLDGGLYWQVGVSGGQARYIIAADYGELTDGSDATTIACSACGNEAISVGAYVSRTSFVNLDGANRSDGWTAGDEYPLSGKGPTFDGRTAPLVSAPGAYVISAINSFASAFSVSRDDLAFSRPSAVTQGRTDYWGAMSGTSMATPVVTGALALWLQANPDLTSAEARSLIDGMGKIDIFAGLQTINAGIDTPIATPQECGQSIYDLNGRLLRNNSDTTGLAGGFYLLRGNGDCRKIFVK